MKKNSDENYLIYRFHIQQNDILWQKCKLSKDIYNQTLFVYKKTLREENKWLRPFDIFKIMRDVPNLEDTKNYELLGTNPSRATSRVVVGSMISYCKLIKQWSKNGKNPKARPRMPHYIKEDAFVLEIPAQSNNGSLKQNGYLLVQGNSSKKNQKKLLIKIPNFHILEAKLKEHKTTRFIPQKDKTFIVEIVYVPKKHQVTDLDYTEFASIDLGVNNIATLLVPDVRPILFNGQFIKSKNRFFNKEIGRLQSCLGLTQETEPEHNSESINSDENKDKESKHKKNRKRIPETKKIRSLRIKRENLMKDYFHKLSTYIVRYLINHQIGNLVVGRNKGWKQEVSLGHRTNQNFAQLPHFKLIQQLSYKCKMYGINFYENEENYTSKCDALALEKICKHSEYSGKRVKRGLFKSAVGKTINADVNGAINIMRKMLSKQDKESNIQTYLENKNIFQPRKVYIL